MSHGSPVTSHLSEDFIGLDKQETMTGNNLKLASINVQNETPINNPESDEFTSQVTKPSPDDLQNGDHDVCHQPEHPISNCYISESVPASFSPTIESSQQMETDISNFTDAGNVFIQSDANEFHTSPAPPNDKEMEVLPNDPLCAAYQSQLLQVHELSRELEQLKEKKNLKLARIAETKLEFERLKQVFYSQLATSDSLARDLQRQNMELRCLSREECVRQVTHLTMDVATNLTFTRLRQECKEKRSRLQQVCDNLQGFKYTPDSAEARVLRLRLKHLLDENKRLGAQSGSLRVEQLLSKTSMLRRLNEEHRRCTQLTAQAYDDSLEDMVGLQSTVLLLEKHLLNSEAVKQALISRLEKYAPDLVNSILSRDIHPIVATVETVPEEQKEISHHPEEDPMETSEILDNSNPEIVQESADPSSDTSSYTETQVQAAHSPSGDSTSDSKVGQEPPHPNVTTPSMNISLKDNVPTRTS